MVITTDNYYKTTTEQKSPSQESVGIRDEPFKNTPYHEIQRFLSNKTFL